MKQTKTKLLCLLLAALMLLSSLTACGKDKAKDSNLIKLGDYELLYKGACIMEDSDGNDAIVLTLDFTNNGKENASYLWSVDETVMQNGVELEVATVFADYDTFETVIEGQFTDVAPGATLKVRTAYLLQDTTSPVEATFEQFFGKNSKGETFLDTLVRYGQLYQREQQEAATSLFGGTEAVEIATPPIPEVEGWSTIERLNRERELVGIYLSAHPLDDYEIILNNLCNTHCAELGDKVALAKKEDIVFGGIITEVKSKFTKTGKPCGFVTLEDFEGSGELALFGEDWGTWRGVMVEGSTIFVTAKCVARYGNSNYLDFKISTVEYLQTVKENRLEKFTISIDSSIVDDTLVNDLKTLVENDEGHAQLFIQIHDSETNTNFTMRAQDRAIGVSRELIQFVNDNPKMSYQIN